MKINVGIIKIQKSRYNGIVAYKNTKFATTKKINTIYNGKATFNRFGFNKFHGLC
jgi:hypothetical protein